MATADKSAMTRRAVWVAIAIVAAVSSHQLKASALEARRAWPDTESFVVLPPPKAARALSLGYRQFWADFTFARALVYRADTRREVTEYRYLDRFIENIIALDPKFERVYKWAPYAVMFKNDTVTAEELELSLKYLELGMQAFPDDYEYFWVAGMRYYLDLWTDDPEQRRRWRERGADLIEQAMHKPNAPDDLVTLAASMRSRLGQKARALRDLREMIMLTDNEKALERMLVRYHQIAGAEFPDEAKQAKREFERAWQQELPFAPPSLFVLLGERPSPVIDFDALANERDLFGVGDEDDDSSGLLERDPPGEGRDAGTGNVREPDTSGAGD